MKKYPLFILIAVSVVLVSIPGLIISITDKSFSYPAAAVLIHTIKDGDAERILHPGKAKAPDLEDVPAVIPEEAKALMEAAAKDRDGAEADDEKNEGMKVKETAGEEKESEEESEESGEEEEEEEHDRHEDEDSDEDEDHDEDDDQDDGEHEDDEDDGWKEFTTVDNDYFEDACYIGDSRVQGLGLYSGLPGTNYGITSMQIYRFFDKKVVETPLGKVTLAEALAGDQKFGKIYLGFGLNELGWGNDGTFAEHYYNLIDYIKAVQPDAIIYVMGLLHVTEAEERKSSVFTNSAIDHRNEEIRQIAEDEHVYYLDLNEVFTDENGRLPAEDSFDGIHIKANAMYKWADYLKTHAIEPD